MISRRNQVKRSFWGVDHRPSFKGVVAEVQNARQAGEKAFAAKASSCCSLRTCSANFNESRDCKKRSFLQLRMQAEGSGVEIACRAVSWESSELQPRAGSHLCAGGTHANVEVWKGARGRVFLEQAHPSTKHNDDAHPSPR